MLDGTAGIAHFQCRQMLHSRYHRLAPVFPEGVSVPMDAIDKISYMPEFAERAPLDMSIAWLQQHWAVT
jgi:hypothetical protein